MRNLTSIQSATTVDYSINFNINANDGSQVFSFDNNDISYISPVTWQTNLQGGFSSPSAYSVTITSCLDFIKSNLNTFQFAKANLFVTVNSDTFNPHVGRIRDVERVDNDPNSIKFKVYDLLLERKLKFPAPLTDSYSNLHPETISSDWGVPTYYGKNTRPFYFTPVDCELFTLLGPRNVSSENINDSKVLFFSRPNNDQQTLENLSYYRMRGTWQQSDSALPYEFVNSYSINTGVTNLTDHFGFEVYNVFSGDLYSQNNVLSFITETGTRDYAQSERTNVTSIAVTFKTAQTDQFAAHVIGGYSTGGNNLMKSYINLDNNVDSSIDVKALGFLGFEAIDNNVFTNVLSITTYKLGFRPGLSSQYGIYFDVQSSTTTTSVDGYTFTLSCYVPTYGPFPFIENLTVTSNFTDGVSYPWSKNLFLRNKERAFLIDVSTDTGAFAPIITTSMTLHLESNNYKNYSVFAYPVSSSDTTAISSGALLPSYPEHPLTILTDIFDKNSLAFNYNQGLTSGVLLSNYKISPVFIERQEIINIADEFGNMTGTNIWVADSGQIEFAFYTNSSTLFRNETVKTVNENDFISFKFKDNPIGNTNYKSQKYNEYNINFDYVYHKNTYSKTLNYNFSTNSYCEQINSFEIYKSKEIRNKYIVESSTAHQVALTEISFNSTISSFVEGVLPARFFNYELNDRLTIQNPMIVGSESQYQIINISHDYMKGQVSIIAQELVEMYTGSRV